MSERAGRYTRSFGGMVGAMIVLIAVVVAFVLFRSFFQAAPNDPAPAVSYRADLAYYRSKASFPLLAPPATPEGWKATSVRFEPAKPQSWHLGYLTGDRRYVGIEQAHRSIAEMVEEFVADDATRGEDVDIDGATWQTYTADDGDAAVVRRADGVTTLVVGSDSDTSTVTEFAGTLRDH
ncbi:MAG: DUF4245 domain-containing protein [Nocardioidaceae bacterium]